MLDGNDVTIEGVNIDARKILIDAQEESKIKLKNVRKHVKKDNYDLALKEIEDLYRDIEELERRLNKLDSGIISVIFGYFTSWTLQFMRTLFLTCLGAPFAAEIANTVEIWKKPVKKFVHGEKLTLDDLNAYKNIISERMRIIKKSVKKTMINIKDQKRLYDQSKGKVKR